MSSGNSARALMDLAKDDASSRTRSRRGSIVETTLNMAEEFPLLVEGMDKVEKVRTNLNELINGLNTFHDDNRKLDAILRRVGTVLSGAVAPVKTFTQVKVPQQVYK